MLIVSASLISDIALTQEDPLARAVRRRLRMKEVHEGIPYVSFFFAFFFLSTQQLFLIFAVVGWLPLIIYLVDRVVYSTEVPGSVKLLPLAEKEFEKGAVHELGALDDFRVRILPVIGKSSL